MSACSLTIVIYNKEVKVAQCQYGGNLLGQGKTILNFLNGCDIEKFKDKLSLVHFLNKVDEEFDNDHLGSKILEKIYNNNKTISLRNSYKFAADGRLCEYVYVIDLDTNLLEVYRGLNTQPLNKNDRFFELTRRNTVYTPVKLAFRRVLKGFHVFTKQEIKMTIRPLRYGNNPDLINF